MSCSSVTREGLLEIFEESVDIAKRARQSKMELGAQLHRLTQEAVQSLCKLCPCCERDR